MGSLGEGEEKGKRRAEKGESGISEGRAERPGVREDILGGGWNGISLGGRGKNGEKFEENIKNWHKGK